MGEEVTLHRSQLHSAARCAMDAMGKERLEISEKQKERDGKLRQRRITVQYVW